MPHHGAYGLMAITDRYEHSHQEFDPLLRRHQEASDCIISPEQSSLIM